MPQIAEIRMIDDAVWARIPIKGDDGRVQFLTDVEITANDQMIKRLLDKIERLQSALRDLLDAYLADVNPNDRNQAAVEHARRNIGQI